MFETIINNQQITTLTITVLERYYFVPNNAFIFQAFIASYLDNIYASGSNNFCFCYNQVPILEKACNPNLFIWDEHAIWCVNKNDNQQI